MFKFKKIIKISQTKKNDSILILSAVLLLILSGLLVFLFSPGQYLSLSSAPKIIGGASLTIDFGNGEKRAFEGGIIKNETLIDVLNQAARAGDFSYKLNEESDLASIGGLVGGGKKSWHWYLNEKKINRQPGEITVKPNDRILIKYESR